jgi:hypothetical protein
MREPADLEFQVNWDIVITDEIRAVLASGIQTARTVSGDVVRTL